MGLCPTPCELLEKFNQSNLNRIENLVKSMLIELFFAFGVLKRYYYYLFYLVYQQFLLAYLGINDRKYSKLFVYFRVRVYQLWQEGKNRTRLVKKRENVESHVIVFLLCLFYYSHVLMHSLWYSCPY